LSFARRLRLRPLARVPGLMMRALALVALCVASGCDETEEATQSPECALVSRTRPFRPDDMIAACKAKGITCNFVASYELPPSSNVWLKSGSTNLDTGVVTVSIPGCASNVEICWFMLYREMARARGVSSENEANCYAAASAPSWATRAAVCDLETTQVPIGDGNAIWACTLQGGTLLKPSKALEMPPAEDLKPDTVRWSVRSDAMPLRHGLWPGGGVIPIGHPSWECRHSDVRRSGPTETVTVSCIAGGNEISTTARCDSSRRQLGLIERDRVDLDMQNGPDHLAYVTLECAFFRSRIGR